MASKFEEALWRFRIELLKEYGANEPISEIRLSRECYERVITETMSRPEARYSVADFAEPEFLGIKVLPEKR